MKIAIGNNHRGYRAKRDLISLIKHLGHEVEDFGCHDTAHVDFPDVVPPVGKAVASNRCELGILIGGNGMGMCMAANKVHGVRAAVANDEFSARCTREQHHCNVLCLAAEADGDKNLGQIVTSFLSAQMASGSHARMVEKVMQIEEEEQDHAVLT